MEQTRCEEEKEEEEGVIVLPPWNNGAKEPWVGSTYMNTRGRGEDAGTTRVQNRFS